MNNKTVYTDNIYKNNSCGSYATETFLRNVLCIQRPGLDKDYTLVEDRFAECEDKTIRCVYSQLFFPDSAMILCNKMGEDPCLYDGIINGECETCYDEDGNECEVEESVSVEPIEIYQFYIVDRGTAEYLMRHTEEIIFDYDKYELYILGVTHYGTPWDGVAAEFKDF